MTIPDRQGPVTRWLRRWHLVGTPSRRQAVAAAGVVSLGWTGVLLARLVAGAGDPVASTQDGLDPRILALLAACGFGPVLAVVMLLLPGALGFRILFGSALGLIGSESVFAGGSMVLLGLFSLCAALLYLWRGAGSTIDGIILVGFTALVTFAGTPRTVPLLVPVVLALVWTPDRPRYGRHAGRSDIDQGGRIRRWAHRRRAAIITAGVLVLGSAAVLFGQPRRLDPAGTSMVRWLGALPAALVLCLTVGLGLVTALRRQLTNAARAVGRLSVIVVVGIVAQFVAEGPAAPGQPTLVVDFLALLCIPLLCACGYCLVSPTTSVADTGNYRAAPMSPSRLVRRSIALAGGVVFVAVTALAGVGAVISSVLPATRSSEPAPSSQPPAPIPPAPAPQYTPTNKYAGTVYANVWQDERAGDPTVPGARGGSGNLAGTYFRDGRFYLATVGHVANVLGHQMFDYGVYQRIGRVAYSTGMAAGGDSGDGTALVDLGTAPAPPRVRVATADLTVATDSGTWVTIPSVATVSAVLSDVDETLPAGAVACHSSFFDGSPTFTAGGGYRCGRLARECGADEAECWSASTDGTPFVASGDSGGPVWRPLPDGTVQVIGIARHQRNNLTQLGFTPTHRFEQHDWTTGVLPGYPAGRGGSFVTAPRPPTGLSVSGAASGALRLSWQGSAAHPADPVRGYRIKVDDRQLAEVDGATRTFTVAASTAAGTHQYTVEAVDQWGIARGTTTTVTWG